MCAIVITSHGGVEAIAWQKVENPPPPTADRVRVRVRAAGLNRADLMQREGHYPAPPGYMGERLLVHAAGSGVGTAAVQLSHAAGAIVYGTFPHRRQTGAGTHSRAR